MSGHSKWATTKHQKARTDAKRSNLFTKIANVISVAARTGGDPEMNFSLRLAIDKARAANMPKDNIERAIKRGTGELGGAQIEEVVYEAYGQGGSAILIEAATDNKNRTSGEIKAVLNKLGGKLASANAVSYLFQRRGEIRVSIDGQGEDDFELEVIDSGAQDYRKMDGEYLIYTKPEELKEVEENLKKNGKKILESSLVYDPKETIAVSEENSEKIIKLLSALDDLDDVTQVSSNLE